MVRAQGPARALLIGTACLFAWAAGADAASRLDPRYAEILRRYARGERPEAVAALGSWTEGALHGQVAAIEDAQIEVERCPNCPMDPLAKVSVRAAVMVHADRDEVERPQPIGREETPRCPGPHARIANLYAATLARHPLNRDFARRFFLATALRLQNGACLDDAHNEAIAGLALFPRDAELLLASGSALEERAFLTTTSVRSDAATVQKEWLTEARRDFTQAIASDPDLVLARVRLGRVLWRLGQPELARTSLAEALGRARDSKIRYLAHLFLGRIHEDAQRLDQALAEYRQAVEIDPEAQSAAVALSHVLQLAGESEESRHALVRGLVKRPTTRDPFWDYVVANTWGFEDLLASLRRETLE